MCSVQTASRERSYSRSFRAGQSSLSICEAEQSHPSAHHKQQEGDLSVAERIPQVQKFHSGNLPPIYDDPQWSLSHSLNCYNQTLSISAKAANSLAENFWTKTVLPLIPSS